MTEIIVDNEKSFSTCLYRYPNQIYEELENVSSNLDLLLSNINDNHPIAPLGDFNAKWCNSDKSNRVDIEPDNITTSVGRLINEPTQFVNKTSSSTDLIFCLDLFS